MLTFPNCKINLGLNILQKRSDGFHNLESVFFPLPLKDVLEIIQPADDSRQTTVSFSSSGIKIDSSKENNLCIKAYELVKKDFPQLPPVQMHLHKAIPAGAGLGGGSADGAFTLKLLNQKFNLGLPEEKLIEYALLLGSDCPFFIINKPCLTTGRGEFLQKISLDLSGYIFILVNPGVHINTKWAFEEQSGRLQRPDSFKDISKIIQQPITTWKAELKNDFEELVFEKYPEIKMIKEELYKAGAEYASMSGSGSTVYGIFKKDAQLSFSFPSGYFVKELPG